MVLPSFLINNDYDNTLWYNVLQDYINIIVELKNKHPEFISKFGARGSIFRMSCPDSRVRNPKGLILENFVL